MKITDVFKLKNEGLIYFRWDLDL